MEVEGGAYQGGGGDRRQTRRSGLIKQNNAENEGAGRINQLKQSASISRVGLRSSDNTGTIQLSVEARFSHSQNWTLFLVVRGDAEVEAKMKKLNSKIKSIERKLVRKTSELNQEMRAIQQRLVAATKEAKIEASKAKNSHGQLGNRKSTSRLQQQLKPLLNEPQSGKQYCTLAPFIHESQICITHLHFLSIHFSLESEGVFEVFLQFPFYLVLAVAPEASPRACARSLRPRSGLVTPNPKAVSGIPKPSQYKQQQQSTPPSGRKRKAVLDGAPSADKHDTPSKSPKTVFPGNPCD